MFKIMNFLLFVFLFIFIFIFRTFIIIIVIISGIRRCEMLMYNDFIVVGNNKICASVYYAVSIW